MRSFFIAPVFNKENLIAQVCNGILQSVSKDADFKVIFIIDGCTDNSEAILKKIRNDNIILLHADDVHEIRSLNMGLSYIRDNLNPSDDDLVFTVQDDVVIQDTDVDLKFKKLFDHLPDLGYISWRLGCSLHLSGDSIREDNFVESEFGHWSTMGLTHFKQLKHNKFTHTEAVIRSPTCVLWKRYKEVGFYNEDLAPCGFDCHDFSIRMNLAGFKNGILALKYQSDVDWGSTREKKETNVNSKIGEIFERNKRYVAKTYNNYFLSKA